MNMQARCFRLCVLSTVTVLLLGAVAYFAWNRCVEAAAARYVRQLGGVAVWTNFGPQWLAKLMGRMNPFQAVTVVMLAGTNVTDRDLPVVLPLRQTTDVELNGSKVTGLGLSCLRSLPKLQSLDLSGSSITDKGLQYVGMLTNLDSLGLVRTKITDQGVRHLQDLKNLKELYIWRTGITDLSLSYLSNLPLESLDVSYTFVTSNGISNLEKVKPSIEIHWLGGKEGRKQ